MQRRGRHTYGEARHRLLGHERVDADRLRRNVLAQADRSAASAGIDADAACTDRRQAVGIGRIRIQLGRDLDVVAAAAFLIDTFDEVLLAGGQRLGRGEMRRERTAAAGLLSNLDLAGGINASGVQVQLRGVIAAQIEYPVAGGGRDEHAMHATAIVVPIIGGSKGRHGVKRIEVPCFRRVIRITRIASEIGHGHAANVVVRIEHEQAAIEGEGRELR